MTSGMFPYSALLGFDSGHMLLPVYVVVGAVSVYNAMLVLSGTCLRVVYGVPVLHVFSS